MNILQMVHSMISNKNSNYLTGYVGGIMDNGLDWETVVKSSNLLHMHKYPMNPFMG